MKVYLWLDLRFFFTFYLHIVPKMEMNTLISLVKWFLCVCIVIHVCVSPHYWQQAKPYFFFLRERVILFLHPKKKNQMKFRKYFLCGKHFLFLYFCLWDRKRSFENLRFRRESGSVKKKTDTVTLEQALMKKKQRFDNSRFWYYNAKWSLFIFITNNTDKLLWMVWIKWIH